MVDREAFTLRISQATPAGLVVINYELIAAFLTDAIDIFANKVELNAEEKELFRQHVSKARDGITQLINSLDFDIGMAHDLYQIYEYIFRLLIDAFFGCKRAAATEALELTETLLTGWREAAKQELNAVPVSDAPQVYAGLTYHRDGLSEHVMNDDAHEYKA